MLALQSQLRCPSAARLGLFSHAKAACHESWLGCGSRAWPRWSCLGWLCIPDCHCARSLQATNMLTCEPPDVLWCLVWLVLGCEMRVVVSQSVAECHSVANGVRATCAFCPVVNVCPGSSPLGVRGWRVRCCLALNYYYYYYLRVLCVRSAQRRTGRILKGCKWKVEGAEAVLWRHLWWRSPSQPQNVRRNGLELYT